MTTVFASKCSCSAHLERKYKNKIKVKTKMQRCYEQCDECTESWQKIVLQKFSNYLKKSSKEDDNKKERKYGRKVEIDKK
jgi:hypothetical protein